MSPTRPEPPGRLRAESGRRTPTLSAERPGGSCPRGPDPQGNGDRTPRRSERSGRRHRRRAAAAVRGRRSAEGRASFATGGPRHVTRRRKGGRDRARPRLRRPAPSWASPAWPRAGRAERGLGRCPRRRGPVSPAALPARGPSPAQALREDRAKLRAQSEPFPGARVRFPADATEPAPPAH